MRLQQSRISRAIVLTRIDALNGAVARLTARIQALEDSGGQDRDSLLGEIKRLSGLLDQKANASDFAGLQDDLGLLGATIAALQGVVGILQGGFDLLSAGVGQLFSALASLDGPAQRTANEALAIAQNAVNLAQKAIGDAARSIDASNAATGTANRAIEITNSTASQVSGAISQAAEALGAASRAISVANSAQSTADRSLDIAISAANKPALVGAQGAQGIPGAIGATGAQGIPGSIGAQGIPGAIGAIGAQGIPGAIGAQGIPGLIGAQGIPGSIGAQGIPGSIGATGAQGIPGSIGAQGIPGIGSIGATGAQGVPGSIGATGAPGIPGSIGATGAPGIPGINSDASLPGRVGVLESKVTTLTDRPQILNPDRPGAIPVRYPTTGTIVHVPTDDYVQGEFVEEKKKITKLGGDLEPLKNDNNENKRKIAVIEQNCCKPQDETKPKVELETASITQFVNCDPTTGKPVFSVISLPVVKGTGVTETAKSLQMARVNALECKECDAIATVPEWWQIPIENYRPQLILIYRVLKDDGTWGGTQYAITIPNPNDNYKTRPPTKPSFPNYKKGNYQGILRLKDNTKLIVNCKDAEELKRLMSSLIGTIDRPKLPDKGYKTVIHPEGTFNQANVKAWRVDYYPTGRGGTSPRGIKPSWVWRL